MNWNGDNGPPLNEISEIIAEKDHPLIVLIGMMNEVASKEDPDALHSVLC